MIIFTIVNTIAQMYSDPVIFNLESTQIQCLENYATCIYI